MHLAQRNMQVKLGMELSKSFLKNVECIFHNMQLHLCFLFPSIQQFQNCMLSFFLRKGHTPNN